MNYELHETDPFKTVSRKTISVRAYGIPKLIIVKRIK
jgi:hypothetical protein